MGKTHHRGTAASQKDMRARHKRPCISAPSSPANVTLKFKRVHRQRQKVWNGHVKWDAVTTDVAGRDLPKDTDGNPRADGYQIELRATDQSGDVIELPSSQEDPYEVVGGKWQVAGGTTVTKIKSHELRIESSGGIIDSGNLSSLTTGIQETVNFFARCESGSPTVKFEVWNQTDGTSVVSKNATLTETHHGKLAAHMKFTPSAGKAYRFRMTWSSGSGKPIITKAEYWDAADAMVWKKTAHDEDTGILFKSLERPKVYYYQARVRARSNHHGHRCWSAWSAWTVATNPVTGDEVGGPAAEGLVLTFEKTGKKHNPFRAITTWNEVGWFIPPMGDAEEGAKTYAVKLAQSSDNGSTTDWTHHHQFDARDADADTTVTAFFDQGIKRNKVYRAAVRWQDHDSNWSAWSPWTVWADPKTGGAGSKPNAVQNLTKKKVRPGVLKWTWDPPAGEEDVDKYRIKIYRTGTLVENDTTRSEHYRYNVPKADQGTAHKAVVSAVDHEGYESTDNDSGDITDDLDDTEEPIGTIKQYGGGTPPSDWLKCNGNSYSTASPYDLLFAVIGYTYGGSGTQFNVPDLRTRHLSEPDDTTTFVGDSDGLALASREMGHQHLEDLSADDELDDTSADNENTDSTFDNELIDNTGDDEIQDNTTEATHGHFVQQQNSDPPSATTNVSGAGTQGVGGPNHSHNVPSHNTNSGASHKHGHQHGHKHGHQHDHHHGHKHGHNHRHHHGHKHRHQHDRRDRPHLYCRHIIKYQ